MFAFHNYRKGNLFRAKYFFVPQPVLPAFLPDPRDGSIYMIGATPNEPLKKLPFTIPELVAASPCKSSDGILYTGKKVSPDELMYSKEHEVLWKSINCCESTT